MRVAIFSDNDFDTPNSLTTTLRAVLRHAPPMWQPRIYTAAERGTTNDSWFSPSSMRSPIPWHADIRVYMPRVRQFARELQRDGVDLIHLTTPGPVAPGSTSLYLTALLSIRSTLV